MVKEVVVYTCITADKDSLKNPEAVSEDCDYVAFLDLPAESDVWEVRKAPNSESNPRRNSRIPKLLAHKYFPKHKYSIWLDGSIQLLSNPRDLIDEYLVDTNIATMRHPWRSCIYKEANECAALCKESPEIIYGQIEKYRRDDYPENNGLAAIGIILRRHSPEIEAFNELWWKEYSAHSQRDQLSFNYCIWKLGIRYTELPWFDEFVENIRYSGHNY